MENSSNLLLSQRNSSFFLISTFQKLYFAGSVILHDLQGLKRNGFTMRL